MEYIYHVSELFVDKNIGKGNHSGVNFKKKKIRKVNALTFLHSRTDHGDRFLNEFGEIMGRFLNEFVEFTSNNLSP